MAGVTVRAALAVDVVNISLRHPFLLAGQLAVARAASADRLEVGLGAGSYRVVRFDHSALAVRFPPRSERCERLARCCQVFPALWRGETVTDDQLGVHGALLGQLGIQPRPIVVGGISEATMQNTPTVGTPASPPLTTTPSSAATSTNCAARWEGAGHCARRRRYSLAKSSCHTPNSCSASLSKPGPKQ